jgi:hypothetical protein
MLSALGRYGCAGHYVIEPYFHPYFFEKERGGVEDAPFLTLLQIKCVQRQQF